METEETKADKLMSDEGTRVLLKSTTLNFIGNLTVEPQLRKCISEDMGGLLSQLFDLLESDVRLKGFDWVDAASRALHSIINCSIEPTAKNVLANKPFEKVVEGIFKSLKVKPEKEDEKELLERTL